MLRLAAWDNARELQKFIFQSITSIKLHYMVVTDDTIKVFQSPWISSPNSKQHLNRGGWKDFQYIGTILLRQEFGREGAG